MIYNGELVRIDHPSFPTGYRNKLFRVEKLENGNVNFKRVSAKDERLLEHANNVLRKYSKWR